MVVDVDGLWLVSKNDWVLVSGLVPTSDYQLDVFRDRSAVLFEKTSTGSFSEKVRLSSGQVPPFEVTGVHSRNEGVVEFKQIEVTTTTSEIPRPSKWMFLGYALIGIASLSVVFGEWLRFRRSERTEPRARLFAGTQQNWWLWVATLVAIVIVPPSHSESWIVEDLRVMDWVLGVNLGDYLAKPFGGFFYFLLGIWARVVTPVWLLRAPIAIFFVVAANSFVWNFLTDRYGSKLSPRPRTTALIVLSTAVFGQGEWIRPEIPILSMWMFSMSLLARMSNEPRHIRRYLILVGLLAGLILHHPLGVVAALSIALFLGHRLIRHPKSVEIGEMIACTVVASALAVSSALFGQNAGSFFRSIEYFGSKSTAHEVNFQLLGRLKDLNNATLLFNLSVALCLAAIGLFIFSTSVSKTTMSSSFGGRLLLSVVVSSALVIPAGPWALYFVYLAPLTAVLLSGVSLKRNDSFPRLVSSAAVAALALFVRAFNQPLAESVFLAIGITGGLLLVALLLGRNLIPMLSCTFFIGIFLIIAAPVFETVAPVAAKNLSERCNRSPSPGLLTDLHLDCLYTWSTTDGSQWGDWVNEAIIVSRASGGAYKPVNLSLGRFIGLGRGCGYLTDVRLSSETLSSSIGGTAHIAHAYVLLSPCTKRPRAEPNLEEVSAVIHGRSSDMNFYNRVLASILEHNGMSADMLCLSRDGVTETTIPIEAVVTIDEPNCVVLTSPFRQVLPDSIQWSEYSR
jgi:hypothetical protein